MFDRIEAEIDALSTTVTRHVTRELRVGIQVAQSPSLENRKLTIFHPIGERIAHRIGPAVESLGLVFGKRFAFLKNV